jgi:ABC-type multidrug transport system ATPase subunit
LCDRAVFFQNGVIAAEGPVAEVAQRFGWDFALSRSNRRP